MLSKKRSKDKPLKASVVNLDCFYLKDTLTRDCNAIPLSVTVLALGAKFGVRLRGKTNSAWQVWRNGRCLWAKQAQRKWSSVWAGDFSLSR